MLELNFTPFPTLITGRLLLRQLLITDAPEILALHGSAKVNTYLERVSITTLLEAETTITSKNILVANKESVIWAITRINIPTLIGTICLWNFDMSTEKIEVGYELHPTFEGQGFANEALIETIKFGFTKIKALKIEAYVRSNNSRSKTLLKRNNFVVQQVLNDASNTLENSIIYELAVML